MALLEELQFDRNLRKKASQTDATEDAAFSSNNPVINVQNNSTTKKTDDRDSTPNGAKDIITGSVITACLIQTSASPSRIELAGNDLSLYDDTSTSNGKVTGDTSRIFFTHDLDSGEGFVIEKRASVYNTYDNVLSFYAFQAKRGAYNYMFFGRNAYANDEERNISTIVFGVDSSSIQPGGDQNALNGVYRVEWSIDGASQSNWTPVMAGDSRQVAAGVADSGFSSLIMGGQGGIAAMGYGIDTPAPGINFMWYIQNDTEVTAGAHVIPDVTAAYDLGSPSMKFRNIYGTPAACSLPTVENALGLLDEIPEPANIGGRGHFGEGLYFDDQTFPDAISFINSEGNRDIDLVRVTGFLLKAVKELNEKVKALESQLNK